jgi:hypothetical protein
LSEGVTVARTGGTDSIVIGGRDTIGSIQARMSVLNLHGGKWTPTEGKPNNVDPFELDRVQVGQAAAGALNLLGSQFYAGNVRIGSVGSPGVVRVLRAAGPKNQTPGTLSVRGEIEVGATSSLLVVAQGSRITGTGRAGDAPAQLAPPPSETRMQAT